MSLILDALRKSEAERRRGQAPDLYAELPPLVPRATARRPAWPWWLAGGLALLATLWMLRDVQSMTGAATAPAAGSAATRAIPPPELAPAATAQAPLAMPAPTPPAPPATAAVIAPATPGPAPAPAVAGPVATTAMAAATTAEPPLAAPAPVTDPALPAQPSPVQVASTSPPPATAPAPVAAPAAPAPLRLADLSAGEREQLPALKISMHMWGPTPDQRFAIIDGARVGQGDRVGDAVVEEIGADSVVLNWHGQRLALPIR